MTTLEEIKKAIMALSPEDFAKFREWFWEYSRRRDEE